MLSNKLLHLQYSTYCQQWRIIKGNQELSSLDLPNVPTDRDLELWAIADSAPESLGVMRVVNGQVELIFSAKQKQRFNQGKVLAISLEPKGGSPTGSPTGAVLFTGKLKI